MTDQAILESLFAELTTMLADARDAAPAPVDAPEPRTCTSDVEAMTKNGRKYHASWCTAHGATATGNSRTSRKAPKRIMHDCEKVHPELFGTGRKGQPVTGHVRWAARKAS